MPRCHEALPYVKLGKSEAGATSADSEKSARVAAAAAVVVERAMRCGLSHREAAAFAGLTFLVGVDSALHPERAETVKARLYATTVGYVVAKRARRAA